MLNNIFTFLILTSSVANADTGKFILMTKDKPAPFKGVLFDETATSKLLALPDKYRLQCDLDMEYEIDKINTKNNLKVQNLELDIERIKQEHQVIIETKDRQLENLNTEIGKRNGIHRQWYLLGGVALGVGFTTGMFAIWNSSQ